MAASFTKARTLALVIPGCSYCGGSWLSNMRYRLFTNYETEEKSTHFGYKRVSEREKTQKGTQHACMYFVLLSLLVAAH